MKTNSKKEKLRKVWLKKIKKNIHLLQFAPEELRRDKDFIGDYIFNSSSDILLYASDEIKSNIDFILKCVSFDSIVLKYASEKLKSDINFVLRCLEKNSSTFEHVSNELKNKDFILYIIKKTNCNIFIIFDLLPEWMYDDYDIILAIMRSTSFEIDRVLNYSHISARLSSDKTFILEAIKITPDYLYNISDDLKDYEEIALFAVSNNPNNISFLSKRFKEDKLFILLVIENSNLYYSSILNNISINLCNDFDVVLKAVSTSPREFKYASEKLRDNEEILIAAINCGRRVETLHSHSQFKTISFISYSSKRLQNNFDIMLNAVILCFQNIRYISDELKMNEIFMNAVLDIDLCWCIIYHKDIYEILLISKQLVLKTISKFKDDKILIPKKFKHDNDIILHLCRQTKNYDLISMLGEPFSNNTHEALYNYIQVNDLPSIVYTINNDGCITNIAGKVVYRITDSNITFSELSKILYNIKNEYMSFINVDREKITPFDGYKKITDVFTNVQIS
jgi:hypothetical protein